MITSLRLVNFKNFADETLRVGPFTVIVGANASGKSNIRDAFRFLHGIGRRYTLAEILGGKYGPGGQLEWAGIRGATNEIIRFGHSDFSIEMEVIVASAEEPQRMRYAVEIVEDFLRIGTFRVNREQFKDGQNIIYNGESSVHELLIRRDNRGQYKFMLDQPALSQDMIWQVVEPLHYDEQVSKLRSTLADLRFLDLVPDRMRDPTFPGANVFGDSGDNLPTVLEEICHDPKRRETLTSWLKELTPMDVKDFEFPRDPSGRVHLQILEANGRRVSAFSASDGTLRFLAMLAALLSPNASGLYFFEEIENGIHPSRLWLLLELIENQTAKGNIQVVATTHSPDLLALVNDTTLESTSVVSRLEDTEDAIIRPVDSLPNVNKLRKSQGLGRLHAGGWMETALAFTEGYNEEDDED